MAANPYSDLPADRFWRKAVADLPPFAVDPRPPAGFRIARTDRVATAGSCFAQNVAKALRDAGFRYHVIDHPPEGMDAADTQARQYGVYSARYGNLYHVRQLVQLFDRAHGDYRPDLGAWERPDGRFVDPFRPTIEPAGFADAGEVEAARAVHLAEVRALFAGLDVFIFTLGLTEGWRHRADGAALPLAPGVAGGVFDPQAYAFVNSSVAEVVADLRGFLARLRGVNPDARVILTVSPVPLIATYEDRHVLISNAHSKAVLRAAAGEVCDGSDANLAYFPAYDLITASVNAGRYYAEDQRSITQAGVRHVMRTFLGTFDADAGAAPAVRALPSEFTRNAGVVCDEEAIEHSLA